MAFNYGPFGEQASNGDTIYSNCADTKNYTYDGSGNMLTQVITQYGNTYTKTYTWVAGLMTSISLWVKS